jgi:lipoate-protein ligase A
MRPTCGCTAAVQRQLGARPSWSGGARLLQRAPWSSLAPAALPPIRVLRLRGLPVYAQLCIEEALLRADAGNWVLLNQAPVMRPTVVLGIGGNAEALVHAAAAARDGVPLVRRFSGGGTVVVDAGTVFVSFVCNKAALPDVPSFPRDIMAWTSRFYAPVFADVCASPGPGSGPGSGAAAFQLLEHDYVLGARKVGGNAQSISRDRWVHHTSFLWDFDPANMAYLKHPPKAPAYRAARAHTDFLARLRDHAQPGGRGADGGDGGADAFLDRVTVELGAWFTPLPATLADASNVLARDHRRTNVVLA